MPSQYAHYRFGNQALTALPGELQRSIRRFRPLYDMGQQGPDFFFYFNPLWKTATGALGHSFHQQTGVEFFTRSCLQADSEAARVYLFGLLGHYCLDSVCHPYVHQIVAAGEAPHVAMEKEFDRYLMASDGIENPACYDMNPKLRLTRGECVTAAAFFPPATPGNVLQAIRHMRLCLSFLAHKDRAKREKLINRIDPGLAEHFIPEAPVKGFSHLNPELLDRYQQALELYPRLLEQLQQQLRTGKGLGADFEAAFG